MLIYAIIVINLNKLNFVKMRKEENEFIIRFRRKLVILEVVKCIFASIVIAIIVDTIIVKALFESISHLLALILATIFNYPFVYFLYFRPKIERIKNDIWDIAKEKSIEKVNDFDKKKSNLERMIYRILLLFRSEKQKNKWQNRIYQIEMYKPL